PVGCPPRGGLPTEAAPCDQKRADAVAMPRECPRSVHALRILRHIPGFGHIFGRPAKRLILPVPVLLVPGAHLSQAVVRPIVPPDLRLAVDVLPVPFFIPQRPACRPIVPQRDGEVVP